MALEKARWHSSWCYRLCPKFQQQVILFVVVTTKSIIIDQFAWERCLSLCIPSGTAMEHSPWIKTLQSFEMIFIKLNLEIYLKIKLNRNWKWKWNLFYITYFILHWLCNRWNMVSIQAVSKSVLMEHLYRVQKKFKQF